MPSFSQTNYQDQIVDPLKYPNIATQITIQNILNRAVRSAIAELDLRSTIRTAPLASKLFDDVYDYACPTDMKAEAIIDLVPQFGRTVANGSYYLVHPMVFDRRKTLDERMVSFHEDDLVRRIRASLDVNDTSLMVASFNSKTADGGTWAVYNDATNAVNDGDNYVEGSGSVKFDLTGAATTAGLYNSALDTFDLTKYKDNGSAFVWIYVNTIANLTNFILEIGNSTSNYYSMTATTNNEGVAFYVGWNLVRFDFSGKSTTGTVTDTTAKHVRLYMTKSAGKSDDGYRFDGLSLHTGEYYDVMYYSRYGWQTNAGVWQENSSAATDKLNCDTDEFDLLVAKGKVEVAKEMREYDQLKIAEGEYAKLVALYRMNNPSKRMPTILKITTRPNRFRN
jgi:hypothetical protein